jgi:hypothetical protein
MLGLLHGACNPAAELHWNTTAWALHAEQQLQPLLLLLVQQVTS